MTTPEPQKNRSPLYYSLSAISGACFGSIPGVLIASFGPLPVGVAVVLIGIPIGIVFSLGLAAPGRTAMLLIAVIVARNSRLLGNVALDLVDQGEGPSEESNDVSDQLFSWLAADDIIERRSWWVFGATIIGVAVAGMFAIRDYLALTRGSSGWILSTDNLTPKNIAGLAVVTTLAVGIWAGALAGLCASAAFRRPIGFAMAIGGYLSTCARTELPDHCLPTLVADGQPLQDRRQIVRDRASFEFA